MKFKKAPLIELVAEFRWIPVGGLGAPAPNSGKLARLQPADQNRNETFFSRFSSSISERGYSRTERLIPQGWPFPNHLPVCIIRHSGTDQKETTLYQVGAGLFSAHALPPYKNWDEFRPVVSSGLEVLLKARDRDESDAKFTTITLRYIDRFESNLTDNLLPRAFIDKVFDIGLRLPNAITSDAVSEESINPTILLRVPLKSGLLMTLGINPIAEQGGHNGIILDTSVVTQSSVPGDLKTAIEVLDTAHASIRKLFIGLTAPIQKQMEPED